ncbi:MAG TPA: tetratricopeptide repeat protein [Firmicutes bacterium]|nr:tetratricopeptide repeat protein [Bacillota bacterium]
MFTQQDLNEIYSRVVENLRWDDTGEAEALLQHLERVTPESPRVLAQRAAILAKKGKLEEAETLLHRVLEGQPSCTDAWVNLGNLHYLKGRYREAAEAYLQALRIDPKLVRGYHNITAAYAKLGLKRQARRAWRKARRLEYVEFLRREGVKGALGCGTYATLISIAVLVGLLLYLHVR